MMEDLIYGYLIKNCVGYDNRIKGNRLMKIFKIKDEKVFRSQIEKIRDNEKFKRLIGSEAGCQGGYWIIKNLDEYRLTAHHLCARAEKMKKTYKSLEEKVKNKKERGF